MLHAHGHVQVQQPVLPLDVPVLQQPMLSMLPLGVSVQQQHLLPLDLLVAATLLLVCVSIAA